MAKKKPHPADIYAGQQLRAARIMLGYSQTDIANHCGITFQQVQKYERGTNRISVSRLSELCKFLKQPVTFFFESGAGNSKVVANALAVRKMRKIKRRVDEIHRMINEEE